MPQEIAASGRPAPGTFIVLRENKDCRYYVHDSEASALKEAQNLATKERAPFLILTPIVKVEPPPSDPPIVTDLRLGLRVE